MRVGRGNSLLVPCSQGKICIFWAEFGDFWFGFENFPVNFAVLVMKDGIAGRDRPVSFNYCRQRDTPWKRSNAEAASALRRRYVPGRLDAIPVARALHCRF
jgi:hypothetical protein